MNKSVNLSFYQIALKRNLKKQLSIYQLCTIITIFQPSPLAIINRSNNSSQTKNLYFANLNPSLDPPLVNEDFRVETSLVDDKLTQVLALHTRWNYKDIEEQGLERKAFQPHWQIKYRKLRLIIFGFTFHNK